VPVAFLLGADKLACMKQASRMMLFGCAFFLLAALFAIISVLGLGLLFGALGAFFLLVGRSLQRQLVGYAEVRDASAAIVVGDWAKAEALAGKTNFKSPQTRASASILCGTTRLALEDAEAALRHYDEALLHTSSPRILFEASRLRIRATAYVGRALALAVSRGSNASAEVAACLELSGSSVERFPLL
jgi:hypothetical protein